MAGVPVVLGTGQTLFPVDRNTYLTAHFYQGRGLIHLRRFSVEETAFGISATAGGGEWFHPHIVSMIF